MTLRFGSIVIHKPDPASETDNSSNVSGDEAEVAEIAETAIVKYNNRKEGSVRRLERQKRAMNKSRSLERRRGSFSSSGSGSSEISILRIMNTDRSPPLVRSHYTRQAEERLQGKAVHTHKGSERSRRVRRQNSVEDTDSDGERLGFRVLTSGSRTPDKIISRRCGSTVVPDITTCMTTPFVPIIDDDAAIKGISRLLKNLNFTEKLRQHKAEQERLDIHKLPQHMREQLKHIYVY